MALLPARLRAPPRAVKKNLAWRAAASRAVPAVEIDGVVLAEILARGR
jgi:hypothetical protein